MQSDVIEHAFELDYLNTFKETLESPNSCVTLFFLNSFPQNYQASDSQADIISES